MKNCRIWGGIVRLGRALLLFDQFTIVGLQCNRRRPRRARVIPRSFGIAQPIVGPRFRKIAHVLHVPLFGRTAANPLGKAIGIGTLSVEVVRLVCKLDADICRRKLPQWCNNVIVVVTAI